MLLEMEHVSRRYTGGAGVVQAVQDVSLSLDAGQFVAVCGPSGCGKSTLLLMAGAVLRPDSGSVRIAGQNPGDLSADERAVFRGRQVGFVFQQFCLVPYLSVLDNVLAPALAVSSPHARERALQLLSRFGLEHRLQHVPAELSSGERQRTAMARALLNQPRIILADEPTGNLDAENADRALSFLTDFARSGGAVLLVTHDAAAAGRADRIVHMQDGRVVDRPSGTRSAAFTETTQNRSA